MASVSTVVLSRQWHRPEITVSVNHEAISLSMSLDDFITALLSEVGSPTMLLTRQQLLKKVAAGREKIESDMREQSIHGM